MNQEQELDRNETATPHKLAEARKRGQVSKSSDLVSALVMAAAAMLFYATGWDKLVKLFKFDALILQHAGTAASHSHSALWVWELLVYTGRNAVHILLPSLVCLMLVALLANLGQTGAVWSWHPVKPDWQRLNPASGFRRVWSLRTLFDAARAILKLIVLCVAIGLALRDLAPQFHQLAQATPYGLAGLLVQDLASMALNIAAAMGVIALIDLSFTRREFNKNMRMSRREVRDEHKQREGDPRIRSRLRELRREMLRRSRVLQRTGHADVVVTNPTHVGRCLDLSSRRDGGTRAGLQGLRNPGRRHACHCFSTPGSGASQPRTCPGAARPDGH